MTLRTRLQSAPAGNRELDAELALALGWQSDNAMWWRGDDRSTWELGPPKLTTSLDAITREISFRGYWRESGADKMGRGWATVLLDEDAFYSGIPAATEPLAICAALAALNPETDDEH